jgi:hypothetical protein
MFAVGVKKEPPARPHDTIPLDSKHGDALWSLLMSCWSHRPTERPNSESVVDIVSVVALQSSVRKRTDKHLDEDGHEVWLTACSVPRSTASGRKSQNARRAVSKLICVIITNTDN